MKVIFTKHAAEEKFLELEKHGWKITKTKVKQVLRNPKWKGISKHGEETAMGLLDEKRILRIVFRREDVIIIVITIHVARRGRY